MSPSIVELKPGVLFVHEGSDVKQYFVSSGFAFIHANSVADIVANEAVPLNRFDSEEVRKGVQEYTQRVSNAKDDLEGLRLKLALKCTVLCRSQLFPHNAQSSVCGTLPRPSPGIVGTLTSLITWCSSTKALILVEGHKYSQICTRLQTRIV